jgi:hypothetical protein
MKQWYSKELAEKYIAAIRTDLDSFSEAEASILENHGYWLADAAIKTHVSTLYPTNAPVAKSPNPNWDGPEERLNGHSNTAPREPFLEEVAGNRATYSLCQIGSGKKNKLSLGCVCLTSLSPTSLLR